MRALARSWGWEVLAVAAILVGCAAANVAIMLARPAMVHSAMREVDAELAVQQNALARQLAEWRREMAADGRWAASLAALALDGSRTFVDSLVVAQIPTARLWLIDAHGTHRTMAGASEPKERHRWLAAQSLTHDTTVVAATDALDHDLRIGVAARLPGKYAGWAAVLDVSAVERLRRRMPRVSVANTTASVALTFPFGSGFVSGTWAPNAMAPSISWPKNGAPMTDSSLVVRAGNASDTTPRFEIAVPRSVATSMAATRAEWLHVWTIIVAMPLCVIVLLIGRSQSRIRTARAESAATRASLAAVQARLHPHFLSNALHSASALIAADPDAAEEALDRLGDLFRYTLASTERESARLADEWAFVADYLEIEQLRLGTRLRAELDLDPALANCAVPVFVLQPLVENAIRHGVGPRREGGTVRVRAASVDGRIELRVEDNGVGADANALAATRGTGLRTLRERLALDERWRGEVQTETSLGNGFVVRVLITSSS